MRIFTKSNGAAAGLLLLLSVIYWGYPLAQYYTKMADYRVFLKTPSTDPEVKFTKLILLKNSLYKMQRHEPTVKTSTHLVQVCALLQDWQCLHDEIITLSQQRVKVEDHYLHLARSRYHLDREKMTPTLDRALLLCEKNQTDAMPCWVLRARALQNSERWDDAIMWWDKIIARTDTQDSNLALRKQARAVAVAKKNGG